MPEIDLKGLHLVRSKGRLYVYAWRGGPRLKARPGTDAFNTEYAAAIADRGMPDARRFASIVVRYKASQDYLGLAESTRKNWGPWLDRIRAHFGDLSTAQFARAEKIRPIIRRWRAQWSATPRTADYGMQVLSRLMSYAVDPLGELPANPCEGIRQLYSGSRADIIWTEGEMAEFRAVASQEVRDAVELAAATGLRAGDLVRLSWSHVGASAIVLTAGKRVGRARKGREVVIPIYADLRALLDRIPRLATTVLTNSRKRPWTVNGLSSSVNKAKDIAWPQGENLHFHDLRGTAATRLYLAGLTLREIAEMMGWEEETVERIIRRYVGRDAAIRARIARIDEARRDLQVLQGDGK